MNRQYRSEQYSFNKEIDENFSEKIVEHFEIHPVRLKIFRNFSKVHTGHYTLAYDQFLKAIIWNWSERI